MKCAKKKMIEKISKVSIVKIEKLFLKITKSINRYASYQLRISW